MKLTIFAVLSFAVALGRANATEKKLLRKTAVADRGESFEEENKWFARLVQELSSVATPGPTPGPMPGPTPGPPDLCRDVTCTNEIEGCDPFDGQCKELDQIIPCVAIIDENEDSESQATVDAKWATFRETYPDRPFCLLKPAPASTLTLPTAVGPIVGTTATNDPRFTYSEVSRDQGDVNIASDWFTICGLGAYSNTQIDFVGKFLDTSGSMDLSTVSASNTLFVNNIVSSSLTIQEVFNGNEDYITPFLTTLVPGP